jgi:hypothetical protein
MPYTPGNVMLPVDYGTSVHGGWNSQADAAKRRNTLFAVAGALTAVLLLRRL